MRKEIHPEYVDCTIVCTCGNTIQTRSTKAEMHTEICSACHPFFSGKQKMMDTAGRVERFQKRYGNWKEKAAQQKQKNIEKNKGREGAVPHAQTDKDITAKAQPAAESSGKPAKADRPVAEAAPSDDTAKVDQPVAEAAPSDDTVKVDQPVTEAAPPSDDTAKVDQPVAETAPSDDTAKADQPVAEATPSDDTAQADQPAAPDKSPEGDTKSE